MIRIERSITAALNDWGQAPVFLDVSRANGAKATSALEFSQRIADATNQLNAWGIRKGYLVPVFLTNSVDFITIFLALLRIGAIPVMAKLEYRTLELDEIFSNARPEAVITEKEHLPFLEPYLQDTIVVARSNGRFSLTQSADGVRSREDVPDGIASINYTYRGYGYPLGAMLSHAQYLHGARVLQDGLHGTPGERMLSILPMCHIFTLVGCILVPLLYRMTTVLVDTMHPRLLFQHIRDCRIDYVTSIPEIYEMLRRLRDADADLSSLKVFISGGSRLTAHAYDSLKETFSIEMCHGYGLTECTPVSGNRRYETRPGTVGSPCEEVSVRIDSTAADRPGEILVHTPYLTGLYYRRPRESAEASRDGWFRTGDVGRLDNGHLVFEKELKNTRKINGKLVDIEEISRAILMDKDIADLRVDWGDNSLSAHLAVSRRIDFAEKTRVLRNAMKKALAEYKIPSRFEVLTSEATA